MNLLWTLGRSLFPLFHFVHCLLTGERFVPLQQHIQFVLSCLLNPSALAAEFEQVIIPVLFFLALLLTRH